MFVNTALYCLPLSAKAAVNVRLVEVAPTIFTHEPPLFVLTCHCTVGTGIPVASEVKVTEPPGHTVVLDGCEVTEIPEQFITRLYELPLTVQPPSVACTTKEFLRFRLLL